MGFGGDGFVMLVSSIFFYILCFLRGFHRGFHRSFHSVILFEMLFDKLDVVVDLCVQSVEGLDVEMGEDMVLEQNPFPIGVCAARQLAHVATRSCSLLRLLDLSDVQVYPSAQLLVFRKSLVETICIAAHSEGGQ